jgi:hypothetical protein
LIKEDLSLSNPYQVDLSVAMYHERSPLPDTRYTDQFPSYQTTEGVTGHSSATHRISPNDRVRLSSSTFTRMRSSVFRMVLHREVGRAVRFFHFFSSWDSWWLWIVLSCWQLVCGLDQLWRYTTLSNWSSCDLGLGQIFYSFVSDMEEGHWKCCLICQQHRDHLLILLSFSYLYSSMFSLPNLSAVTTVVLDARTY